MNRSDLTLRLKHIGLTRAALALAAVMALISLLRNHGVVDNMDYDTPSYLSAWADNLSHGHLDLLRTPLYPAVLGFAKWIGGSAWLWVTTAIQIALYMATLPLLIGVARRLIPSVKAQWLTVLGYVAYYPTINCATAIGTEGIALPMVIAMMWLVVRLFDNPGIRSAAPVLVLLIAMVALRPSLLVVAATFSAFSIVGIFVKCWRRVSLWLLGICAVTGIACQVYAMRIEKLCGLPVISVVTIHNEYFIVRQDGHIYDEFLADRPDVVALMHKYKVDEARTEGQVLGRLWSEVAELPQVCDYPTIRQYVDNVYSHYPELRLKWLGQRIVKSVTHPDYRKDILYYIVALTFAVAAITTLIRRRRLAASVVMLGIYTWGSICMVIGMTQNEWPRLLLPTVPALALMAGMLVASIRHKSLILNSPA